MATTETTTADTVNAWFTDCIATGPIGRSTEAYNQALAAKDILIDRLVAATPAPTPGKAATKAAAAPATETPAP